MTALIDKWLEICVPSSAYLVTLPTCVLMRVFSHGPPFPPVLCDILDVFGGPTHPGVGLYPRYFPSGGTKMSSDWLEAVANVLLLITEVLFTLLASCPPQHPSPTPPPLFLMKCECPFGSGTKGVRGGKC